MRAAKDRAGKHFLDFGPFSIDLTERVLCREGRPLSLTPKAFETLVVLVESAGYTLEKDDLMQAVWGDTAVEENNLTQAISALRKALGEDAATPRYVETVPRRGYRFIAQVTEREEEAQTLLRKGEPRSEPPALDFQAAETIEPKAAPAVAPERRSRRWLLTIGVPATVVVLAGASYLWFSRVRNRQAGGGFRARRSFAVLGLKNLSGRPDAAWLSTALSEMLTTELSVGDGLRAIPGENVARMEKELTVPDTDSLAGDTLEGIRKDLGADYVVLGSYTDLGKQSGGGIRLDLRVQDAAAGETLLSLGETGSEANLFDLVSRTGAELRSRLGLPQVPLGEAATVRASLPSNPEAARAYSEGLEKLRALDFRTARDLLSQAAALDPQYPLTHSYLAAAWSSLGYDAKATEEARKAVDGSVTLDRERQLLMEGRLEEMESAWSKAADTYRTLFGLYPDNLEYGLRLATAQMFASQGAAAEATIATLRRLPAPSRDDPRIDLEEAALADQLSNFEREREAAGRAAQKGQAQGARLLAARARLMQGRALWKLGKPERAVPLLAEAEETFRTVGDQEGVSEALHLTSEMLVDSGDLEKAKQGYESALAVHRETGDQAGVAANLNDIAQVLWMESDFDGAEKMYQQSLAAFEEVGDRHGQADVLNNMANIVYDQGDLARAEASYRKALDIFRAIGDQSGTAEALANVALVLYDRGDLAGAEKLDTEALELARPLGSKSDTGYALSGLGEIAAARGDLEQARRLQEQALTLREAVGEKATAAESQMDLAAIALDQGRASDAESSARGAASEFEHEDALDDQALAEALLARALLAQGKLGEAQSSAARATELAKQGRNRGAALVAATAAARVRAAGGKTADSSAAERDLEACAREAARLGFRGKELEAGLALGEIQLASGDTAAGHATLEAVGKQANASGFGRIARQASEMSKRK